MSVWSNTVGLGGTFHTPAVSTMLSAVTVIPVYAYAVGTIAETPETLGWVSAGSVESIPVSAAVTGSLTGTPTVSNVTLEVNL